MGVRREAVRRSIRLLLVADFANAAVVEAEQGAVGDDGVTGLDAAARRAAVGESGHRRGRAVRQVAGLAGDGVVGASLSQGQSVCGHAFCHTYGFRIDIRAVEIGHIHAVSPRGGVVTILARDLGSLIHATRTRLGHMVGTVARRAEIALAGTPVFDAVILVGCAFIHQGNRNSGAVDSGLDDAVVAGAMRVVAGGAVELRVRNSGDGGGGTAGGSRAITPGQQRAGDSGAGADIMLGGDGNRLVVGEAAAQQVGIVGSDGDAGSVSASEIQAIPHVGVGAAAGVAVAGHAQVPRAGLHQQVRTDGGVRPVTTRASVSGGGVTAMGAAIGRGGAGQCEGEYDRERKGKQNLSH